MDIRVQLSSCVPATHLETSGADLPIERLLPFRDHPKVIGLAEFMNFPGVIHKDPICLAKLDAFQGGHIDGHAPLLSRPRSQRLSRRPASAPITNARRPTEALEKIRKGMHILVREGSVSKDLHALMPIITERLSPFLALCTDDRNPLDIAEQGHLDYMIRTAIAQGVEPLAVYRAASISAARAFGLRDRGLVAPGWRADLVVDRQPRKLQGRDGVCRPAVSSPTRCSPPAGRSRRSASTASRRGHVNAADFGVPACRGRDFGDRRAARQDHHRTSPLPPAGQRQPDRPSISAATSSRSPSSNATARTAIIANGFVQGFGLKKGAIASTVGHDSHNICVVGVNDDDMALAANRLGEIKGGFVVVEDGKVTGEIALPVAGLMSLEPYESVRDTLHHLRQAAFALGATLQEPFLQLAFLPLPVIPHLKISDKGLVDVDRFMLIG